MASALIVTQTNGDASASSNSGVFAGLRFFLVQKLPSRSSFVGKIEANGGRVVKLEAQADHILADHVRSLNCPPGSISYTFVDQALADGALPDPAAHTAGAPKGTVRDVGSIMPTRGTRTPFTLADDQQLYRWVKEKEAKGAYVRGNEIYKALEVINGRHTAQSWRDRYVKKLHDIPPQGVDVEVGSREVAADEEGTTQSRSKMGGRAARVADKNSKIVIDGEVFDLEDREQLVAQGEDIDDVAEDRIDEAWEQWADVFSAHSAASWRKLWEKLAKHEYRKRLNNAKGKAPVVQASTEFVHDNAPTSTSNRPTSSNSVKRKRESTGPRKQATYGGKRQKAAPEMFGEASSEDGFAPNGHLEKTDSRSNVERRESASSGPQNIRRSSPRVEIPVTPSKAKGTDNVKERRRDSSTLSTPDANEAAAMQLAEEYQLAQARPTSRAVEQAQANSKKLGAAISGLARISEANASKGSQLDDEFARLLPDATPESSQKQLQSQQAQPLQNNNGEAPEVPSEENHKADEQHRHDTSPRRDEDLSDEVPLPTSDLNRHADRQLQRESVESNSAHDNTSSPDEQQDTTLHSEAIASQVGDDDTSNMMHAQGDALTEANLASQDQQHREPQVRGKDLPQDDEMQDQTDFVQYLQSLQRGATANGSHGGKPAAAGSPLFAPAAKPDARSKPAEHELEDQSKLVERHFSPDPLLDEGPMASQQELDQIMEDALRWPLSPVRAAANTRPRQESREASAQFETQVPYPRLPSPELGTVESPPAAQEQVRYPELDAVDERPRSKRKSREELQADFDREVLGLQPPDEERDQDDSDVDHQTLYGARQVGGGHDYIDLEVPEPEGGFGFSSSQVWHSQQPVDDGDRDEDDATGHGVRQASQDGSVAEEHDDGVPALEEALASSPPQSRHPSAEARQPGRHLDAKFRLLPMDESDGEDEAIAPPRPTAAISISSGSVSSSSEADIDPNGYDGMSPAAPRPLETQAIYAAETQAPDFAMPMPPSPSPPPTQTAAADLHHDPFPTHAQPTSPSEDVDLHAYVSDLKSLHHYPERAILSALRATSNDPELAEMVLLEERVGKGFPKDVAGVWSAEEDAVLEGGDARGLRRLEEKHGWGRCRERLEWLGDLREEEGEEGDGEEG